MSYIGRKGATAPLNSADIPAELVVSQAEINAAKTNIAMLGFKTAVNGSLAKYNLQDQVIDEYTDASGIDASASTNEDLTSGVYSGEVDATITQDADATGTDGLYTWYKWTDTGATGSFTADVTTNYDYIVVAGGGSGGWSDQTGGGGGAGGFLTGTGLSIPADTAQVITVGAGGAAITTKVQGLDGSASSIASLVTTVGGGGGGGLDDRAGRAGGSGGGANGSGSSGANAGSGTAGPPRQGYDGGAFGSASGAHGSGGGGGAGAAGSAGTSSKAGDGGIGEDEVMGMNASDSYAFLGAVSAGHNSGGARYFAGGGGGSWQGTDTGTGLDGIGGLGGGGNGPKSYGATGYPAGGYGQDATANTGGGGGAATDAGTTTSLSGAGGSGIVILRTLTSNLASLDDLTLQSTDTEAETQPTKADMVMLIEDAGSGVATLGTHIKGYISRDSGTTFTEGTLVDEGDWGTDKRIIAFHDLDISSQPADKTMCYKITTHSAGAEFNTKIHATSIGWR